MKWSNYPVIMEEFKLDRALQQNRVGRVLAVLRLGT